jgi:hypothetical protein
MKKVLLMIIAIFIAIAGFSQDTISIGTGTTLHYTEPIYGFYKYSYTQQIYTSDEMYQGLSSGSSSQTPNGVIKSISLQYSNTSATTLQNVSIYMQNVTATTLSSWLPMTNMDRVYQGSVSFQNNTNGWITIDLDSTFTWDTTKSIMVCMVNNSGVSTSYSLNFYTHTTTYCKTLLIGNNYNSYSYTAVPIVSATSVLHRANIKFNFGEETTCSKPINLQAQNVLTNDAVVTWHNTSSANSFEMQYKRHISTSWDSAQTVTDTFAYLHYLVANTGYDVRVRALCGTSITSDWKTIDNLFTTACGEISSLPFEENFDTYATSYGSYSMPTCWFRHSNAGSSTPYPYVYNPQGNEKVMYFYSYGTGTYNTLFTPQFDTSQIQMNRLRVSFSAKVSNANYESTTKIIVGIANNSTDSLTFDTISSIAYPNLTSTWSTYDVDLASYTGTGSYIVFKMQNLGSSYTSMYLDNIVIDTIPSCSRVNNLTVSNITPSSATISFDSPSTSASGYIVHYRISSASDTTWIQTTATSSPITLNNLLASTTYEYYITTNCGDEQTSQPTAISTFLTECGANNPPYLENFSTNVFNSTCWWKRQGLLGNEVSFYTSNTSSWYYPTLASPISEGQGSNIACSIWGTNLRDWAISPSIYLIDTNQNNPTNYQVEMDVRLTSGSGGEPTVSTDDKFAVVISTDNGLSWTQRNATIWSNEAGAERNYGDFSSTATHIVIPLMDTNNTYLRNDTIKIGIYVESTVSSSGTNVIYVDNLALNQIPSCPSVYGLNLNLVSSSSVRVNFATNNVVENEGWQIAYDTLSTGTSSFNPDSASNTVTEYNITNIPYIISSLLPNHTYYFAVRQTCGGLWSNIISITMPAGGRQTPFTQTFDDSTDVSEWNFVNGTTNNRWIIGSSYNYDTTTTGRALYVSNNNGVNNTIDYTTGDRIYATAMVEFGQAAEFNLSFDWKCIGGYYGSISGYFIITDPNATLPSSYTTYYYYPTGSTVLYNQSDWNHTTINLNGSYANSMKKLVFCFNVFPTSSLSNAQIGAIIDNVSISHINCGTPYNLAVDSIYTDGTQADVSWQSLNGTSTNYLLEYKPVSSDYWSSITVISDTSYHLNGLYPSTKYDIRVQSLCSSGDSSNFTSILKFTTACNAIQVPSPNENFDAVVPNPCWSMYQGILPSVNDSSAVLTAYNYGWYLSATPIAEGMGNCADAYMSGTNTKYWLVTPTYDLGDGTNPSQLEFDVIEKSYSGQPATTGTDDKFAVVISTDNGLTWTRNNAFIWSNDTTNGNTRILNNLYPYQHIIIPFNQAGNSYTGLIKIAFYVESTVSNAYNTLYLDNVQVNYLNNCPKPINVTADTINSTNAYISFDESGQATTWQYIYSTNEIMDTTITPILTTSTNIHLTGLNPSTRYYVWVRSQCDTNIYSPWSLRMNFLTNATAATIPYECNFEENIENNNWREIASNLTTTPIINWTIGQNAGNGTSDTGSYSSYISNNDSTYLTNAYQYYTSTLYRDIDFGNDTNTTYRISFDYKGNGAINTSTWEVMAGMKVYVKDVDDELPQNESLAPDNQDTIGTYYINNINNTWETAHMEISGVRGIKRLCFVGYNLSMTLPTYPAVDNVSIIISPCSTPRNLRTTNLMSTSTDIMFNSTADSYIVEYRIDTVYSYTSINATSNPVHIDSLQPATAYAVRIKGICGNDTSYCSNVYYFTTPCEDNAIQDFPYIESFEDGISCWNQDLEKYDTRWVMDSGYYYSSEYYGGSFHASPLAGLKMAYMYNSIFKAKTKLISPKMNTSELSMPYLSYYYIIEQRSVGKDTLKVYCRANEDSAWILLKTDTAVSAHDWYEDTIQLPSTSTTYQIAFEGITNKGYGIGIDSVSVYENSPCSIPTNIIGTIHNNTATITWNGDSTQSSWQVKRGLSGQVIDVTNPTYTFDSIEQGQIYTIYVRTNCGTSYSSWETITIQRALVNTLVATDITPNRAIVNASYSQGTQTIIGTGFLYKKSSETNYSNQVGFSSSNMFSATITNLDCQTNYIYRPYIYTTTDTIYGDTMSFTTLEQIPPTVVTLAPTNITTTTATLNGNILQGSEQITAQGFAYKLSSASWNDATFISGNGLGNIYTTINGLIAGNEYDVKTFAVTHIDTTYGNVINFTTLSSINDINGNNISISLYPNPTDKDVTLALEGLQKPAKVTLIDVQGREISKYIISKGQSKITIKTSNLTSGVYYVKIQNETINKTNKLIVK